MSTLDDILRDGSRRLHFVGVGGSGMSALAQYRALQGGQVSGSDRAFDQGQQPADRQHLEALGVTIHPQDGSGCVGADAVVASSAVESRIPDLVRARELDLPVVHRAALLAGHARDSSIAVAGSSGKSTVVAMLFQILRHAGLDPGVISGGRLTCLMEGDLLGNASVGSGPLVFEADESDGSLVEHRPQTAVLLNLHRDHMEPERILTQYAALRRHTRGAFLVGDDANLAGFREQATVFGFGPEAELRGTEPTSDRDVSTFRIGAQSYRVPVPGAHNAWNALAAVATALRVGVTPGTAAQGLLEYRGVHRRFQIHGVGNGVEVVDDFAHNPVKLEAVLRLAQSRADRVVLYFQPHGFAPTRFLRAELVETLARVARPTDRLLLAPIYFAGGTVSRDISSDDLVEDLRARGAPAELAASRADLLQLVRRHCRTGDLILISGARDPTLPELAGDVLEAVTENLEDHVP